MIQPLYCHWVTPPSWWVHGALVWYFWGDYRVEVHQRYADGSVTYRLTPVSLPKEPMP